MQPLELFESFVAFGILGLLIEVFFTGIASVLHGDARARCQTYLWMFPVYAGAGLTFSWIDSNLHWHWLAKAPVYTALIYFTEFTSGYVLKRLIGRCPWDYGLSHWTPLGLINLKYLPWWFALACAVRPISQGLWKVVHVLASV